MVAASAAGATVAALLLSGCVGPPDSTPTPTAAPSASSEPIFASDEEALAAAVQAYEAYSSTLNMISRENGEATERIRDVVTAKYAPTIESLFRDFSQRGLTIQGDTSVDSFKLVEAVEVDGRAEVAILLCSDVSASRIINADGADVTPEGRPERSALQAQLVSPSAGAADLLVDGEAPWSGDYC